MPFEYHIWVLRNEDVSSKVSFCISLVLVIHGMVVDQNVFITTKEENFIFVRDFSFFI